jgi:nuclear pore complex protein Nup188
MISLSVLSVGPCLVYIDNPGEKIPSADAPQDAPYILNTMTLPAIHRRVMDISENLPVGAGPMVFGWSIILQRIRLRVDWTAETAQVHSEEYVHFDGRSSGASQVASPPDPYGNAMAAIKDGPVEDPIQYLALTAVNDCKVFEVLSDLALRFGDSSHARFSDVIGAKMRIVILDLIQCSTIVGYIPELVSATLSALTGGQNYWGFVDGRRPLPNGDPLAMFLNDEELVTNILISARARYPYESLPFLKIIRALAACTTCYAGDGLKSVIDFVESVPSFTFILPDVFSAYETTQEEDNNNSIRLIRPVQLFDARARSFNGLLNQSTVQKFDEDFVMPVGTYGRMVSESNPKVAYWFHDYSGFKYFGALLETFLGAGERLDATTGDIADRDSVAEIVGFLATLLVSITKTSGGGGSSKDEALRILEIASSGLGRNRDITTVIFDIFEEELHKQSTSFGSEVPLEVLISCTQFIHALVPIAPGLIWPVVGRSGLLELNRGGGKLSSIVESVELASGRYEFLYSCTRLFEALVEDFVENAVPRKARGKTLTRFGDTPATGVVDQVLSKILLSFTRYLVDVFESSCTWKFVDQDDCRRLSMTISKTFDNILRYAYGLEVPIPPLKTSESITILQKSKPPSKKQEIPTKILLALDSAASHIIESFLSTSTGTLRFQPFLRAFYDGFTTPDTTLFFNESRLCAAQACTVLSFSATLLRASNLLERPASQLESQLFKVSPLIARLYAVDDAYRIPIVALFEALIVSASNNTAEPPSLLGHVGTRTSKNFLRVLSDLDRPLSRDENFLSITHFTSTVISSRQQWFANYLLTGKSSRGLFNPSGKDEKLLDKPLLDTTLDSLSAINDLPKRKAIAMLEFVALAQNHWPWATYNSEKHEVFIRLISDFVSTLKPLPNADSELDACYQTRIAAYIAEILAMHLFHSRQTGKSSLVKDHIPNIDYFVRYAVDNPAYRNSLHENLTKNLENRYIGFKILDLQKTGLETRELGQDYFYDLPLANKMLSFDPIWGKPKGFGNELATANVNLSLVDAQIVCRFSSLRLIH